MSSEKVKSPGFNINLKAPLKPGYVACVVIVPHTKNRQPKGRVPLKLERDIGWKKAFQLATELLEFAAASDDLIAKVRNAGGGIARGRGRRRS